MDLVLIIRNAPWHCASLTIQFPGDHSEGVTPVPIPNTVVKPLSADGTARAPAWESRTLPGSFSEKGQPKGGPFVFRLGAGAPDRRAESREGRGRFAANVTTGS